MNFVYRWLDNGPAIDQALKVLDAYAQYVNAVKKKKLPNPGTKSFDIVCSALDDPLLRAKLSFMKKMTVDVEQFLRHYQRDSPMLPFLSEDLTTLLTGILRQFVKKEHLSSKMSAADVMNFDAEDSSLHKPMRKIEVGFSAEKIVQDLLKKKKITELQMIDFLMQCKAMYVAIVVKLQEKCPLRYDVVRHMDCLNPKKMASKPDHSTTHFKKLLLTFVASGVVAESECDSLIGLFRNYLSTTVQENEFAFKNFDYVSCGVDAFHYLHMGASDKFRPLLEVFKIFLILSHGQASVERGFSVNKECVEDNQAAKSLVARRIVLDHVRNAGGVLKVKITAELRRSCRSARMIYERELKELKTKGESEAAAKRKREEEKQAIRAKQQKLEEELKKTKAMLQSLDD